MSKDFDNTNSGALFKNDKKETPKHPDYRGEINVNGETFWLSAWLKKSKKGTSFMSLAVSKKDGERKAAPRREAVEDVETDFPF